MKPALPISKEVFWSRIEKTEGCWLWLGWKTKDGYGKFGKGNALAHRLMWALMNGNIPSDKFVLHKCDNRACVNPGHLFLGTIIDNNRDRDNKNRQAKGERNGRSKFVSEQIESIRLRYSQGDITMRELASEYKVNSGSIARIITRQHWRHI